MGRVAATTAMLAGCLVAMVAYLPMRRAKLADTSAQQELEGLNRATAHLPAGTPVWAMAPGIELQFYFVLTRGLVWASRSPCLWLQAAIARAELSRGGAPPEHIGSYRESLLALVREDLQRWQPPVMLVLRCADVGCRKRLDLPKWFILHDPAFAAIWSHYTLVERIGRFDLYSNENSAQ
jgi:hypothetical protein